MSHATAGEHGELWRLAHRCGVKPTFLESGLTSLPRSERRQRATPEAIIAVLRSLGVEIDHPRQTRDALRAVEHDCRQRAVEPILVHWLGEPAVAKLRLNDAQLTEPNECRLTLEDGTARQWVSVPDERESLRIENLDGRRIHHVRIALPDDLPVGYHSLRVTIGREAHDAMLFVAPPRAMPVTDRRAWGVFIPLYALRSERDCGVGDLADLRRLFDWTRRHGGSLVGTLPLLASYLDRPCDPSPYAPVSRLFFNELYLDTEAIGHRPSAAGSAENAESDEGKLAAFREAEYVDFAQAMAVKRRWLEPAAAAAFNDAAQRAAIEHEIAGDSYLGEYARFRAVVERHGEKWRDWPGERLQRIRDDSLRSDDADPRAVEYHLFVQQQLRRQFSGFADGHADHAPGRGLYLDLPVGVHSQGFDAWRFAASFASGASCGAPPDELFLGGQNWGFAPLHPQRSRERGHEWFIESIRRHLQFAGLLRIDHVMWLHRMYWVPDGFPATDGVYVRNPAPEELYAILSIESHRHHAAIVGENLGTVPNVVNRLMRRRGLYSLSVGQFSFTFDPARPLPGQPEHAVASMNTHDTPTFAGFWNGSDIDQRVEAGLLDDDAAADLHSQRATLRQHVLTFLRTRDPENVHDDVSVIAARLLEMLGESDAAIVLATLEDLWGEARPQNVPGTSSDRNWSRSAVMTVERMFEHPAVLDALARLDRARRMSDSCRKV